MAQPITTGKMRVELLARGALTNSYHRPNRALLSIAKPPIVKIVCSSLGLVQGTTDTASIHCDCAGGSDAAGSFGTGVQLT